MINIPFISLCASFQLLLLIGCASPSYQNTTFDIECFAADSQKIAQGKYAILELDSFNETPTCSKEERIIEGDILAITLHCPGRPDRVEKFETIAKRTGFPVINGKIVIPHLQSMEVEGLTLQECRDIIQSEYRQQLPSASIFVNFKKQKERFVRVIGARKTVIPISGRTSLSEVIAKAQIPSSANLFKSYVMRGDEQLAIDLYKLIHEGDATQNIVMQSDDCIFIAHLTDATVLVTGEVRQPLVIPVPYGFISTREALSIAGGIPFTGSRGCIQVIRGEPICPKIFAFSWKEMFAYPNSSLLLMPGDIVFISEKPITQWNRFVNQLQPSGDCMQTTVDCCGMFMID